MEGNLSTNFTCYEATKSQIAIRHGIRNSPSAQEWLAIKHVANSILQPVRDHFFTPFSPSSWYRCRSLNTLLGSLDNSQHILGEAVDFEIPMVSNLEVAQWVEKHLVFDQLILEYYIPGVPSSGWVHVSKRENGGNRGVVLYRHKHSYIPGLPSA